MTCKDFVFYNYKIFACCDDPGEFEFLFHHVKFYPVTELERKFMLRYLKEFYSVDISFGNRAKEEIFYKAKEIMREGILKCEEVDRFPDHEVEQVMYFGNLYEIKYICGYYCYFLNGKFYFKDRSYFEVNKVMKQSVLVLCEEKSDFEYENFVLVL